MGVDERNQGVTRKRSSTWILRFIGPGLLVVFLITSDLHQLVTILRQTHPIPLILALLLIIPFLLIKAWRWKGILRELAIDIPFRTALEVYMIGIYLGSITPGQAGDLAKAWFLQSRGYALAPALMSVILDRLFDLVIMATLAMLGVLALGPLLPHHVMQTLLVGGIGGGMILVLMMLIVRPLRAWVMHKVVIPRLPESARTMLARADDQLARLATHPRLLVVLSTASLISAACTFLRLWLVFQSLAIDIPWYVVVGATALISTLQIAPISIAGMGVREGVLIAVLAAHQYSMEQALGLSVLFVLLTIEQTIAGFLVSLHYRDRPLRSTTGG